MKTNSAELQLLNRQTINQIGESIANGPTAESVELARQNVRRAKRLLAQIEEEHAHARKAAKRRERARSQAWIAEPTT